MRVISGTARGTKLKSLEGLSTRPTLDRVKEAIFNIISNSTKNSETLDLFSGSGALSIEALSRGAKLAILCDNNPNAIKIINENLNKTKFLDSSIVKIDDYITCLYDLKNKNYSFDIIFLDPPYGKNMGLTALEKLSDLNLLKDNRNNYIRNRYKRRNTRYNWPIRNI